CRNVLIYLGVSLQKRAFPLFHYALNPRGYLMLGPSETVGAFSDMFELVDRGAKIYAKKTLRGRPDMDLHILDGTFREIKTLGAPSPARGAEGGDFNWKVKQVADVILLGI